MSHHATTPESKIRVLNINVDNVTVEELLERMTQGFLVTPNADHLVQLQDDPDFVQAYLQAEYVVVDSQVVYWATQFLGTPVKEKISGSDFFPQYCEYHRHNPDIRIFLLGAAPGVAARAAERINMRIGRNIIVATYSPSIGFDHKQEECEEILQLIEKSPANVLVVGVGAPRQEKWIARYRSRLPGIHTFMALGATIDFQAGYKPRSPRWMSRCGVEWLFRLMMEPRRLWKRYLIDDMRFLGLIFKQRLGMYHPPK